MHIIIKLDSNAVMGNKHIYHLNQLEKLFPIEINHLSKIMAKISKKRISKIDKLPSPLPKNFNIYGTVIIRDYYFNTIINKLNYFIDNQYNVCNHNRIKNNIRSMMTTTNHANKHVIANQNGKLLLLKIIKMLKSSTHYNNIQQSVNIIIHLISQCFVLNQRSYHDYQLLIQQFNKESKNK